MPPKSIVTHASSPTVHASWARSDREDIAGPDLAFGAVVHHDLHPAREDIAEMDRLARIAT
jgi:hypothetical protein